MNLYIATSTATLNRRSERHQWAMHGMHLRLVWQMVLEVTTPIYN